MKGGNITIVMMTKKTLRGLLAAVLLLCSSASWAYDFSAVNKDDGGTFYYNIVSSSDRTCEVTYRNTNYNSYSGNVAIPETVIYDGTSYTITRIGSRTFYNCTGLTEVTIPENVTSIGDYAFNNCTRLTEVTIPDNVTSIGNCAFYNCTGLKEVNFDAIACTSAGSSSFYMAFDGCSNISKVNFGDNVTIIPASLCYGLTGLTQVTIGNSVTTIGDVAFYNCTGLTEVTIPNSVTEIGSDAFWGCTKLSALTLEDGTETLEMTTSSSYTPFINCPIETLYLGRDISYSGNYSPFRDNKSLTSLTIGEGVTNMPPYAFFGCMGLTSVTIPNSVTEIGSHAFYNCTGLTTINFNATVCTSAGSSSSNRAFYGCSNISTVNFGDNVTIIPDYLCYGLTGLTQITIPESVTTIGNYAFYGCTGLTEVTIPNSVTEIGREAFRGCSGLTEVTIPNSVTYINYSAFCDCSGLTEVNFNATACTSAGFSSVTSAFYGCNNISTFNFGDNVTIIPDYLCCGLTGLTSITIPESVTTIGNYAFRGCSGIRHITIPESVTTLEDHVFYNTGLMEIEIPDGVTELGTGAFGLCESLRQATIGNGVSKINSRTFEYCNDMTQLSIGSGVKEISDSAFQYCTGLTEVAIPNGVTYLSGFNGCTGLTSVTISNRVASIGSQAFQGCTGLKQIIIPKSVTELGEGAFADCTGLTEIYTKNPTPPDITSSSFDNVDKRSSTLYVPVGCKTTYSRTYYWDEFYNIVEMEFEDALPVVQTYGATEITYGSALLTGLVTVGDDEVTEQGFEYWYDEEDAQTATSLDLDMAVTVTGLLQGKTYTFRAYAKTESGTAYGEEMTFYVPYNTTLCSSLVNDIMEVEFMHTDAWETLTNDYADVADEFIDSFYSITNELSELNQYFGDIYLAGMLTDEIAEEIRQGLKVISQEIEDLLAAAKTAQEAAQEPEPDGIESVISNCGEDDVQIYNLDGSRIPTMRNGVNILRRKDGTTRKVLVK